MFPFRLQHIIKKVKGIYTSLTSECINFYGYKFGLKIERMILAVVQAVVGRFAVPLVKCKQYIV